MKVLSILAFWGGNLLFTPVFSQVKFIENKNQWPTNVLFRAQIPQGVLFVEKNSLVYLFHDNAALEKQHYSKTDTGTVNCHSVKIEFQGANLHPKAEGNTPTDEYYNYFIGNNPSHWSTGVRGYQKIYLRDIYPGIDLELFSENDYLKYNFIVSPGGDPSAIKLAYHGTEKLSLNKGNLEIKTSLNKITEKAPVVFQGSGKKQHTLPSSYRLEKNVLSFNIKDYNRKAPLIIDPVVVFSTYSGSFADNFGFTGTYDDDGNGYSGGTVYDFGFPSTTGAFQVFFGGGEDVNPSLGDLSRDAGILKFNPSGSKLLYATYLGGWHNEQPHSMVVNKAGNLLVFGSTFSSNFPTSPSIPGYDKTYNGKSDIFAVILSADGKNILGSTFLGGSGRDGLNGERLFPGQPSSSPLAYNYGDEYRGEIIVDDNGDVYIASCTESTANQSFPVKNGFQNNFGGVMDGCIFKLTPDLGNIIWSTYTGGVKHDANYGLALGLGTDLFVCGGTSSSELKFNKTGLHTNFRGGLIDGYLLKINKSTGELVNATFVGTDAYDQTYFVQADKYGFPYVAGQTTGNYPVSANVYSNPFSGQFITKFNKDLSAIERSTVFGSGAFGPNISLSAFLVDRCERVFISGWGGMVNTPGNGGHGGTTYGMPVTNDAFQKNTDGSDFYVAVFSKNMDELLYATYFGGGTPNNPLGEHVDGGTSRFDKQGIIYQSVCGGCGGSNAFPTTPNAYSKTNNSQNCNNSFFKIDFENLNQIPTVRDTFFRITATETLNFNFEANDKDKYDSLFLNFTAEILGGGKVTPPFATITNGAGTGKITGNFNWGTTCAHISSDTFTVLVKVKDNGCPNADSGYARFKILVEEPPVDPTPEVFCLLFNPDNTITLTWDNFTPGKYFRYLLLTRKNPDGSEFTDTIYSNGKGQYNDKKVNNPKINNYCYSLQTVNICGKKSAPSYSSCSKAEFESPIDSTYLLSASVINNRDIRVKWLKSQEADFRSYELFRSETGRNGNFQFIKSFMNVNDTIFTDTDVNVQDISYCYKLRVTDLCGHSSRKSNHGCTIVLKGVSEPFQHRLSWHDYDFWQGGTDHYQMFRKMDTSSFDFLKNLDVKQISTYDNQLDYDWGGYWYRVMASEGPGGFSQHSFSNDVYLFQKPLLHVPNAFTPNGDLLNEVWGIVPVFVKEYNLKVFNRWGEKIFETDNKKEQWAGIKSGLGIPDNAFAWLITFTGWDRSVHQRHGTVTILR